MNQDFPLLKSGFGLVLHPELCVAIYSPKVFKRETLTVEDAEKNFRSVPLPRSRQQEQLADVIAANAKK